MRRGAPAAIVFAALLTTAACGGNSGGGTGGGGTPTPSPTPTPGPSGSTITISSNGAVSPKEITVTVGSRVTFVNNDSRAHDMNSDPHPAHTDCPEINVGFLQPGQSLTTAVLPRVRNCGFHDHNQPSVTALQGEIKIQ